MQQPCQRSLRTRYAGRDFHDSIDHLEVLLQIAGGEARIEARLAQVVGSRLAVDRRLPASPYLKRQSACPSHEEISCWIAVKFDRTPAGGTPFSGTMMLNPRLQKMHF